MAYLTSAANDPNELLDKLRLFAPSAGWAVDGFRDRTAATGKALSLHAGSLHATWMSQTTGGDGNNPSPFFLGFGHTSYSANANPDVQNEASLPVWTNFVQGPYSAVYFFGGSGASPYLHVVVETQAGTFKHFGTGRLVPQGVVTTGQYVYGSQWYYHNAYIDSPNAGQHSVAFDDTFANYVSPSTRVRADYDGIAPRWHAVPTDNNDSRRLVCGWRSATSPLGLPQRTGHSMLTGRAPGYPLWCAVPRGAGLFSGIGHPPDLRFIRLDSYAPGEEVSLGTDHWKVFPVHRKNGPVGTPTSGIYGYAYRINE